MRIKTFLIIIYSISGLVISLFTAIMTYIIIDEPIGMKMFSQIALTIIATLPIIAFLSYFIGSSLSNKFEDIRLRLDAINENNFSIKNKDEKIYDIQIIHEAITQLSFRLKEFIINLKNTNQMLNDMIASLSHDIRTPLTIIDGYLEEIEDNLISYQELPKVIKIIKDETAYLNELSSEVMLYLQSLERLSNKEKFSLKHFIEEEIFPILPQKKNIQISCKIDKNETILFNKTALKKILLNLLNNAIKFTNIGSIIVYGSKEYLKIEDTGIGIKSKFAQKIFEPFICLDNSKSRNINGFGLGLSIANNLALTNNYKLFLDSSYSNGCRFILQKK